MSVHVGWPDLSESRRRSLCDLISDLTSRIEGLDLLEMTLKELGRKLPDDVMIHHAAQYAAIKSLAELQFPEIRLERDGDAHFSLVRDNQQLRREITRIDRWLANAIACTIGELQHFYKHGTLIGTLAKEADKSNKRR
jgi:hypothetical protein